MTALVCPYVGLQPYEPQEHEYFFGRSRERRLIAANLYANAVSILYGSSGVGKTSILRAGVVPDLQGRTNTAVVYFNDWHDASFLLLLKRRCVESVRTASAGRIELSETLPLDDLLFESARASGASILLLLDQFEEYFLYHPDAKGGALAFDAELARAINRTDVDAGFLIALRDDWVARLDRYRARIPNLLLNMIRLDHLNREAAAEAIKMPLAVRNKKLEDASAQVTIEDALVDTIIREVRIGVLQLSEAAGLGQSKAQLESDRIETAFLQLVLTTIWDAEMRVGSRVLRVDTFNELGRARKIVQAHLDGLLNTLPALLQQSCVRMFPYLVTPKGVKIAHETDDLVAFAGSDRTETLGLLQLLAQRRVLRRVNPPEGYEIFHDVLAPAILDWRARRVHAAEQAARQAAEVKAREEARLRTEARSAGRLRRLSTALVVVALMATAAGFYAWVQQRTAVRQREEADIQRDVAERTLSELKQTQADLTATKEQSTVDLANLAKIVSRPAPPTSAVTHPPVKPPDTGQLPSDTGTGVFRLNLNDVYGRPINDRVDVTFSDVGSARTIGTTKGLDASGPLAFKLPAQRIYAVRVFPTRYRPTSAFARVWSSQTAEMRLVLVLIPGRVDFVSFPAFKGLPERFREIMTASTAISRFGGMNGERLYDALDDLRRAGLLNVFAKAAATPLRNGTTVADEIHALSDIRADRLSVVVGPEIRALLQAATDDGQFVAVPGALHTPPAGFTPAGSFKTTDRYVNLQVTLFSQREQWMADLDIDEADGLTQIFQVPPTALTRSAIHPFDIQQLLVSQHIDPLYRLGR